MSQALLSVLESINSLSPEEKHQLWQILEETIAISEEENCIRDEETIAEIQQVREEYKRGEYITFNQYLHY